MVKFPLLKQFAKFVNERWNIHQRRLAGHAPPWTDDLIMQEYRFCNVRREDDRVTRWIHQHWLEPYKEDYETVIFAMAVARLVNLPETLEELGYPAPWNTKAFVKVLNSRQQRGEPVFTSAYMINAVGGDGETKAEYLARAVLPPLWSARKRLATILEDGQSLGTLHTALVEFRGFGSGFMAAQVLADVKHTVAGLLAKDWYTFASYGPGSRRGLNRVIGRDKDMPWVEEKWHRVLLELRERIGQLQLLPMELRSLDAQNLQNCLCEFDKYQRVKAGEGRPRQRFKPKGEYCK
jgi:hypothetical protein